MNQSKWSLYSEVLRKNWLVLLLPSYLCTAVFQYATALNSAVFGFLMAFIIFYALIVFAKGDLKAISPQLKWGWLVVAPLILLVTLIIVANSRSPLFAGADMYNPWLNDYQTIMRALISGVGGLIAVGAGYLVLKITHPL